MSDDADDVADADGGADRADGADSDVDVAGADVADDRAGNVVDRTVDDGADDRTERETGGNGDRADGSPSTRGRDAPTDDSGRDGGDETAPDPFGEIDAVAGPADPFEEIDPDPVDEDAVWADLVGSDVDGATVADVAGTGPAVDVEGDEAVVPKRSYCERCEHFSDPPETACTNPGTEIRELVDVEHFRVANCPVVERRQHVGESTED